MLRKAALGLVLASISLPVVGGYAAANVLVVDAGGGGSFTTIQAAVDASQSGDTILVRTGAYSGFWVPDRTLSIVADEGAQVSVTGSASIASLSASNTIVLAGLRITAANTDPYAPPPASLSVTNVSGQVRVESCTLTGAPGNPADGTRPAGAGAEVTGLSTRVAFVDCTLRGGDGGVCDYCDAMPWGGPGVYVLASRVALYDCTLAGGDGGHTVAGLSGTPFGGRGGDGVRDEEGFVHLSNSTLTGGDGGYVIDCALGPTIGGDGGDGLHLTGPDPLPGAWSIGATFQPGAGSPHMGSSCMESLPGSPGEDVRTQTGSYFPLAGTRLEMDAPAVLREGHDLVLTIRGRPGAQVALWISQQTEFVGSASWHGVRIAGSTGPLHPAMILGAIPTAGVLTTGIPIGDLPAGVASAAYFLQAYATSTEGNVLGSFAALTVLDSAY